MKRVQSERVEKYAVSSPTENANLLELTAKIISAHIANNAVSAEALPALITSVYASLSNTGAEPTEVGRKPEPAVPGEEVDLSGIHHLS